MFFRRAVVLFAALGLSAGVVAAQGLAITSGAGYAPVVSPDSIAALFGDDLAADAVEATLDDQGLLPTELGGVTVAIDGRPAELLFVSPRQVNLIVPGQVGTGGHEAVVTFARGVIRGLVEVRDVSPALFSLDASGGGPGAILNAVTSRLSPFAVVTPEIGGSDQRTRLALFGTGVRRAESVEAVAVDSSGDAISLDVEFAGPAPVFFGLDQVNVVLDTELDGGGLTSFQISADGQESNVVTAEIESLDEADRPSIPQPPARTITASPVVFATCSAIPGQPDAPCLAYPFEHEWEPSISPHGIAAYELRTALGQSVTVSGEETTFTEWRVQLHDVECSPEPSTQVFPWSMRAVDGRGIRSLESRFGVIEIGPCPD